MSASSRIFNPQGKFCSKRFFSKMKHWMEHHPVISNSVLCLNLWVAGDVLAQYSEAKLLHQHQHHATTQQNNEKLRSDNTNENTSVLVSSSSSSAAHEEDSASSTSVAAATSAIDPMRVVMSAGYGAFIYGPILAVWYPYLDRMCKTYKIAARFGLWGAPIAKVVADELIMSPPCIALFFGYMNTMEGGDGTTYKNKLQGEFFGSWLASITFWPPISLATFRFLPVYAQAPVINAVCIIWDAFLSHRNAVANINEQQAQAQQQTTKDEIMEATTDASSGVAVSATAASVVATTTSDGASTTSPTDDSTSTTTTVVACSSV